MTYVTLNLNVSYCQNVCNCRLKTRFRKSASHRYQTHLKQVSFRYNTVTLAYILTRYYRKQFCVLLSSIATLNISTTITCR
jgi:hypothetical protein